MNIHIKHCLYSIAAGCCFLVPHSPARAGVGTAGLWNHAHVCDTCSGVPDDQFLGSIWRNYALSICIFSWWTFAGLHCEHLPASTMVRDFEQQHIMSTSTHWATGALSYSLPTRFVYDLTVSIFSKILVLLTISMFVMVATVAINVCIYILSQNYYFF